MSSELVKDLLKRPITDLRISVTDRCNFRCQYCMPKEIFGDDYKFVPRDQLLSFEEINRLAKLFAKMGVNKIRITGGEPLLRHDLPVLVNMLSEIPGIEDIALTTNGILLKKYARILKKVGLKRVNVSLDALDERFKEINGRGIDSKFVLEGIEAAQKAGLFVKLNMVVKRGMNDDQIVPMAEYCKNHNIELRFIEFMDVGNSNGWNLKDVVSSDEILQKISHVFDFEKNERQYGDVATTYKIEGSETNFGIIPSVSEPFCSSCTRARISATGSLFTCLFASEGHDLMKFVKNTDLTDDEILEELIRIWNVRDDRYSEIRTLETQKNRKRPEMSFLGG